MANTTRYITGGKGKPEFSGFSRGRRSSSHSGGQRDLAPWIVVGTANIMRVLGKQGESSPDPWATNQRMTKSSDASYRFLAAGHIRRQAKQLAEHSTACARGGHRVPPSRAGGLAAAAVGAENVLRLLRRQNGEALAEANPPHHPRNGRRPRQGRADRFPLRPWRRYGQALFSRHCAALGEVGTGAGGVAAEGEQGGRSAREGETSSSRCSPSTKTLLAEKDLGGEGASSRGSTAISSAGRPAGTSFAGWRKCSAIRTACKTRATSGGITRCGSPRSGCATRSNSPGRSTASRSTRPWRR